MWTQGQKEDHYNLNASSLKGYFRTYIHTWATVNEFKF